MKQFFIAIILFFNVAVIHAQLNTYDFDSYRLDKDEDYKAVEPVIAKVADHLLTTPIDENIADREKAIDFLYEWMQGTPDYIFGTGRIEIILGNDKQLKGILYAAQAEYALENVESVKDNPAAKRAVWTTLQDYAQMKQNHVMLTPKLKELITAYKQGNLDEFIKRHE